MTLFGWCTNSWASRGTSTISIRSSMPSPSSTPNWRLRACTRSRPGSPLHQAHRPAARPVRECASLASGAIPENSAAFPYHRPGGGYRVRLIRPVAADGRRGWSGRLPTPAGQARDRPRSRPTSATGRCSAARSIDIGGMDRLPLGEPVAGGGSRPCPARRRTSMSMTVPIILPTLPLAF